MLIIFIFRLETLILCCLTEVTFCESRWTKFSKLVGVVISKLYKKALQSYRKFIYTSKYYYY